MGQDNHMQALSLASLASPEGRALPGTGPCGALDVAKQDSIPLACSRWSPAMTESLCHNSAAWIWRVSSTEGFSLGSQGKACSCHSGRRFFISTQSTLEQAGMPVATLAFAWNPKKKMGSNRTLPFSARPGQTLLMLAEKLSKPVERSRLWHRSKGRWTWTMTLY